MRLYMYIYIDYIYVMDFSNFRFSMFDFLMAVMKKCAYNAHQQQYVEKHSTLLLDTQRI